MYPFPPESCNFAQYKVFNVLSCMFFISIINMNWENVDAWNTYTRLLFSVEEESGSNFQAEFPQ